MAKLRNILVPTDFSTNSSRAINYACDLARESNSRLHLLNVSKDELDSTGRENALERLGQAIDARSELEIETVKSVVYGSPGDEISNYAREHQVDVVVMGTHGRTGLAHLAMGSVAERVLKESPCPVTVLGPHDGENATCSKAVEVIEGIVGEGFQSGKEEGRSRMLQALVEELRIASTTAILMFDELENRQWIKWENGTWYVVEGEELLDNLEPFSFRTDQDTQAVDLVKRARSLRATDIHLDPSGDTECVVRLRIDGRLREYCRLDRSVGEHLINQFKTLSNVDHADPFHAHEGRLKLPEQMKNLEVRLTSVPVPEGQAVALRILDPQKIFRPLSDLGFSDPAFDTVQKMLRQGEGLILVTGPTGSGKTTTVYSMLETIGGNEQNIVSIEDPVEFMAPFVRQISVDTKHGLTMTRGLRTLLRMDPDVLFIGEIRDREAAEIGMRAAGSGKYVFSTLHTRDIASTITSLRDLGLENRAIGANLAGVVNQRLVRRLCAECKSASKVHGEQKEKFELEGLEPPSIMFEPVGCRACGGTGYRGRVGIFEVSEINHQIRKAIERSQSRETIESQIRATRVTSLTADALAKAAAGAICFADAAGIRWLA